MLRTGSVPEFWDVNAVRVETPGLDAATLLAACERLQAGLAHRKLVVEDEASGAAVRPFFAERGWMHERNATLVRVGAPMRARHDVREVPLSATRALRAAWYGEWADAAFLAAQEPVMARRGMRAFMAGEDGFVTLARGEGAVEIDGLFVAEAARGRGLGTSLLAAALAAGGQERAWIVADDEGRARPLYERLGFRAVWRTYDFTRPPGA